MGQGSGIREVAWVDIAGGGQVVLDGNYAYVGHMQPPHGTSVLDVMIRRIRGSSRQSTFRRGCIPTRYGWRTTSWWLTASVRGATSRRMISSACASSTSADRAIRATSAIGSAPGSGVHRFTFDGRYAYISTEQEGYIGTIVMILDLKDPARPEEVGRWWMEGQWTAGGETPGWKAKNHRCHHPIRRGDRLYVSYWYGGGVILDISDMTKPKLIAHLDWSPPFGWPTHSLVPIDVPIAGHRWMLVADEHVQPLDPKLSPELPAALWMVNITDETRPIPVSCFQLPELVGIETPLMTACHQPVETIIGNEVPAAWFANGLRVIDIANPLSMKQAAWWMPDVPAGAQRVCSNDVYVDHRGLIYLIDRNRGLSILERV